MSMTITLQLTAEMEARLQEGIAHRDTERVRQVLHEAVEPTVGTLLSHGEGRLSMEEFNRLADELGRTVASQLPPDWTIGLRRQP